MKLRFSGSPTLWVKLSSVILMFLCIGLTSVQAQNYKPLDEAIASVSDALQDLSTEKFVKATVMQNGSGPINTTAPQPSQGNQIQLKVFEVSYYDAFLKEAKIAGDVAAAVQALDAFFNTQGQQPVRAAIIIAARADLMDLITY